MKTNIRHLIFLGFILFMDEALTAPGGFILNVKGGGYIPLRYHKINVFTQTTRLVRNKENYYVSQEHGLPVRGYRVNPLGKRTSKLTDIKIDPNLERKARATTILKISANLDAGLPTRTDLFDGSSFDTAAMTSDFNIPSVLYDNLGKAHRVTIYFRHLDRRCWTYHLLTNATEIIATGELQFDDFGKLQLTTSESMSAIQLEFGSTDKSVITTQYGSPCAVRDIINDGYSKGKLLFIWIQDDGKVIGSFSNGIKATLFVIPLAIFKNEQFLAPFMTNVFLSSDLSGKADFGFADTFARGHFKVDYFGGQEDITTDP